MDLAVIRPAPTAEGITMFAVFGISHAKARAMAIKKTAKTTGKGKKFTPVNA